MIRATMQYRLSELKIEQLVSYFQDGVIDLAPPFQRGRVWGPKFRRGLLENILQGKPVPAIFVFKTPKGPKNVYVVLDGKQRLKIPSWKSFFSSDKEKSQVHFRCRIEGQLKNLGQLPDEEVLKFRDYALAIIEIEFEDTANLGEMIQLFVDINQYGVKVKRFDIVKALYLRDPLLTQIFDLVAEKRRRPHDIIYKVRATAFSRVLKRLDVISRLEDKMNRVDVMWEKLLELALFVNTGQHRKPVQILKEFIGKREPPTTKIPGNEIKLLSRVFAFIAKAYAKTKLADTRWATDQTHFYILATALISRAARGKELSDDIPDKLIKFDSLLWDEKIATKYPDRIQKKAKEYVGLSTKQTTDVAKRERREQLFTQILDAL
jgi:hypothetical protein